MFLSYSPYLPLSLKSVSVSSGENKKTKTKNNLDTSCLEQKLFIKDFMHYLELSYLYCYWNVLKVIEFDWFWYFEMIWYALLIYVFLPFDVGITLNLILTHVNLWHLSLFQLWQFLEILTMFQ